jgi:hypothetical protein
VSGLVAALLLSTAPPALSADDLAAARIAWRYFERNYHPATGLVSSVEGYPSTSIWDLGSSLVATVAARELGLVEPATFDERISTALRTLQTQPLFRGELPNKAYHAATGAMTDYQNQPTPRGVGWSALDVGRLASALGVLARFEPRHRPAIARVLRRWSTCDLVAGGELHGAMVDRSGEVAVVQEGRFGYEQYAARALARLGLDVGLARSYDRFAAEEIILGVRLRRDTRDPVRFGAIDALATEPFVLDALEFGRDARTVPLVRAVFDVQKRRWEETGIPTAATEDHVDRPPWFVYGSIWAGGRPWRAVTPEGEDAPGLLALSTKAAFALATLYPDDPYARVLRAAVAGANDPERGWYAGVYDAGGLNRALTANTNGVILEALLWKARGPLHGAPWEAGLAAPRGACPERAAAAQAAAISLAGATPSPSLRAPAPSSPSLTGIAPAPSRGPREFLRLDGSVFGGYRGADRGTVGAVATLWPWGATFLRLGGELTPFSPGGSSRLLWGAGYDDWRDRTFFLHVDNWGPIRPNDALSTTQAEVNAGYKLPRACLSRALCLAPIASVVTPFAGGPYLQARLALELRRTWFVMGGIGWTVPGVHEGPPGTPSWRVVYGFGRADWRPGGLFVTYHDWGPDSRSGNGIVAVGVNWAY